MLKMSEEHQELTACFHYPNICHFNIHVDSSSLKRILNLFSAQIFQGCSSLDIEPVLIDYVTSKLEHVGWKALWISKKFSDQHFIVEVFNVKNEMLKAEVFIKSVLLRDGHEIILNKLKETINVNYPITVSLLELFVIIDDDEDKELTVRRAIAIENTRFFCKHLIRPWDGEDHDIKYTEEVLEPRLQLYFDMENNVFSKEMISKIRCILKEGWIIVRELNSLYCKMIESGSEAEFHEHYIQARSLKAELSVLEVEMEILENPILRPLVMEEMYGEKSCPVNYILSKNISSQLKSNLPVGPSEIVKFEHNAAIVFNLCSDGDRIFLFPGVYHCDTLGWLKGNICIEGIGEKSDIVLEATGDSEVFLNCGAPNLIIKNVTLRGKPGLMSTIVVHGKMELNNCVVDSNGASVGILLLGGSQAFIERSTISNSLEDGIHMRSLSCLHLVSSKVYGCKKNGITIDAAEAAASSSTYRSDSEMSVVNSIITGNGGHGLFLKSVPMPIISLQKATGEFSVLKLCHWLKSKLENSEIENNAEVGIGFSSLCEVNQKGSCESPSSSPN